MSGAGFPTSQDMYLRLRSAANQPVTHASMEQDGNSVCHPLVVRFKELSQQMEAIKVTDSRKYDTEEWIEMHQKEEPEWATQKSADWNLFSLLSSSEELDSTPNSPLPSTGVGLPKINLSKL